MRQSGGDLQNSPRWKYYVSGRYSRPFNDSRYQGFSQLSYAWQDNVQCSLSQNPLTEQDSYAVLNGNIGMSMKDDHYQVTLFVDNILDENHVPNIYQDFVTAFSTNILQFRPKDAERVFGIALRGRF
jgi:iron complex outermembrane receptor protein